MLNCLIILCLHIITATSENLITTPGFWIYSTYNGSDCSAHPSNTVYASGTQIGQCFDSKMLGYNGTDPINIYLMYYNNSICSGVPYEETFFQQYSFSTSSSCVALPNTDGLYTQTILNAHSDPWKRYGSGQLLQNFAVNTTTDICDDVVVTFTYQAVGFCASSASVPNFVGSYANVIESCDFSFIYLLNYAYSDDTCSSYVMGDYSYSGYECGQYEYIERGLDLSTSCSCNGQAFPSASPTVAPPPTLDFTSGMITSIIYSDLDDCTDATNMISATGTQIGGCSEGISIGYYRNGSVIEAFSVEFEHSDCSGGILYETYIATYSGYGTSNCTLVEANTASGFGYLNTTITTDLTPWDNWLNGTVNVYYLYTAINSCTLVSKYEWMSTEFCFVACSNYGICNTTSYDCNADSIYTTIAENTTVCVDVESITTTKITDYYCEANNYENNICVGKSSPFIPSSSEINLDPATYIYLLGFYIVISVIQYYVIRNSTLEFNFKHAFGAANTAVNTLTNVLFAVSCLQLADSEGGTDCSPSGCIRRLNLLAILCFIDIFLIFVYNYFTMAEALNRCALDESFMKAHAREMNVLFYFTILNLDFLTCFPWLFSDSTKMWPSEDSLNASRYLAVYEDLLQICLTITFLAIVPSTASATAILALIYSILSFFWRTCRVGEVLTGKSNDEIEFVYNNPINNK